MTQYYFKLNLAPKSKARPRFDGNHAYHDKTYTNWLAEAAGQLSEQWQGQPLTKTTKVTMQFWGPRRGDLDNIAAGTADAMVRAGILQDDRLSVIDHLEAAFEPSKTPCIEIWVDVPNETAQIPANLGAGRAVNPGSRGNALTGHQEGLLNGQNNGGCDGVITPAYSEVMG